MKINFRLALACIFFIFSFLQLGAYSQSLDQTDENLNIHAAQNTYDHASNYKEYTDPETGKTRIMIGSISHRIRDQEYVDNENEIDVIKNATIPPRGQNTCIFYVNSAEELRSCINNTSCGEKIIMLKSGRYEGPIYIGNNSNNITIQPDPKMKGSVVLDALNADFNIAIDNTSYITVRNLTIKNADNAILLENAKNCFIYNNKIYGFIYNGISVHKCIDNNSIENNTLNSDNHNNSVSGIRLSESKDVLINHNNIEVGYDDIYSNINNYNFIDILLYKSYGNSINFNEVGIIIEDNIICAITCNAGRPLCSCDSYSDDCSHFLGVSNSTWSFKC